MHEGLVVRDSQGRDRIFLGIDQHLLVVSIFHLLRHGFQRRHQAFRFQDQRSQGEEHVADFFGCAAGKVFGAVVILFGVGFFSLLTASFSAYFVSRGEIEIEEEEIEEIYRLKDIVRRMEVMEQTLQRIENRLNEDRRET